MTEEETSPLPRFKFHNDFVTDESLNVLENTLRKER